MSAYPISLAMHYSKPDGGGYQRNATQALAKTWRRSIRTIGGYWIGTAEWDGPTDEKLDIFENGLMSEIREIFGGLRTWEGFIGELQLTYKGQTYLRSWDGLANRVKVQYSEFGHNLVDNPSCEAANWTSFGTHTTFERSTVWATEGLYSCHMVSVVYASGATIDASITIEAGVAYQIQVSANIISGEWAFEVDRTGAGGSEMVLDKQTVDGPALHVFEIAIDESNTYAGTVGLHLYSQTPDATQAEIYADAALFQATPGRADTGWYDDSQSQDVYGVMEEIISKEGMADEAAVALALTTLYEKRWPRTKPPEVIQPVANQEDKLAITVLGYVFTLRNRYSQLFGTSDAASALVTSLIAESEFISSQYIQSNSLEYLIEDYDNLRIWDVLADIAAAGDASGNYWQCGVFALRKFLYSQIDSNKIMARVRNGKILDPMGAPLDGWFAEPGLVTLDDLPVYYPVLSGRQVDKVNNIWLDEVEFSMADYLAGGQGIAYRKAA